jgi:hypothetical protein
MDKAIEKDIAWKIIIDKMQYFPKIKINVANKYPESYLKES